MTREGLNPKSLNSDATIRMGIEGSDGSRADVIATNGHLGIVAIAPGHSSTKNSTEALLLADAVFTGDWEDITNFGVIIVSMLSDVASATDGLKVEFSTDGTVPGIISDDVYTVSAGAKKTFSFQAATMFYRVVYTNGGTNQASFQLQTVLKPYYVKPSSHRVKDSIVGDDDAELIKAVITGRNPGGTFVNFQATAGGNFKMSLEEFDETFNTNPLPVTETAKTAFGDLRTAELHPQFQGSFEYTVDNTDLTENAVVNGGTITQASGMAVLGTSTTTLSSAMLNSRRHARYKSGLGGVVRFTVLFDTPVAATEQYVGLADETGSSAAFENGYTVGYDGETFGYHRFQNGVKITKAIADWDDPLNGSGRSGEDIDQTKLNIFFIQYQYLGAGAINIFFEKQDGTVVLVHTEKYAGLNIEPSTHNPNFHFMMFVDNKGTTSDIIIKSSSYAYFVEGKTQFIELHQPQNATELIEKTSVSTEIAILTIRNKATYVSKTNFIDIHIQNIAVAIEAANANNLGDIRVVKNTTLGGTPSYTDINTSNSVVEIDVAGTTLTGGVNILPIPMAGKNDKDNFDVSDKRIILGPGETLTISGTNTSGTATFRAAIQWRELF